MARKRVTQIFPWLIPFRRWQRNVCFYAGMKLDGKTYAEKRAAKELPFIQAESSSPLYNENTGFDRKYQENKVFNLKLAAKKLDGLLIRKGETFSFWHALHKDSKGDVYKDGLVMLNGQLTTIAGGGLCQMSNLLFDLFLHSPLTVTERTGHGKKDFPDPGGVPAGVDATVSEGWSDLKVKNDGPRVFQLKISFDEENIYGYLKMDSEPECYYEIFNKNMEYRRVKGKVYQSVGVYQRVKNRCGESQCDRERKLYENCCEIGYALPQCVEIKEG